MYIVHVVQAHANVRPRAQRCSPVAAHGIRSRHTWWSYSKEASIIYVPPSEHGVIYKAGSTLYGTPRSEQLAGHDGAADRSHNSTSNHLNLGSTHAVTVPAIRPASVAPNLQRAAGVLTKMLKPWERPKTSVQVRPAGSTVPAAVATDGAAASVTPLAGKPACSSSMYNSSHCSALNDLVIHLPDSSSLISSECCRGSGSSSSSSSPSSRSGATDLADVLPAAVQPLRKPPAQVLLHRATQINNSKHLMKLIDATSCSSSGSSSNSRGRSVMIASPTAVPAIAAVVLPSQLLKVANTLQHKAPSAAAAAAAAPAATWAHSPSSRGSSSSGLSAWRAPCSSNNISAAPAFRVPGCYAFDQGPSSCSSSSSNSSSGAHTSGRGGAQRPGAAAAAASHAAAAAAAAGGKGGSSSAFGALPLASLKIARMGVALMGLATAAAIAVAFTADSDKYSKQSADLDEAKGSATAKQSVAFGSSSSSSSGGRNTMPPESAAAEDTPGYHEWMVQRLQTTLQQFDAERDMLNAELDMLQALKSSKGQKRADRSSAAAAAVAGNSTTAAAAADDNASVVQDDNTAGVVAAAAAGGGMWGRLRRWYGSSSSSTEVAQATPAAMSSGGSATLTAAAISARIAEIHDQVESLDVLKAALTAELIEQQRQQQQQQLQQ